MHRSFPQQSHFGEFIDRVLEETPGVRAGEKQTQACAPSPTLAPHSVLAGRDPCPYLAWKWALAGWDHWPVLCFPPPCAVRRLLEASCLLCRLPPSFCPGRSLSWNAILFTVWTDISGLGSMVLPPGCLPLKSGSSAPSLTAAAWTVLFLSILSAPPLSFLQELRAWVPDISQPQHSVWHIVQ